MNLAARNLESSFLMAAFVSGVNQHSLCLTSLEPGFNSSLCSANSLGTLGMSPGFHVKDVLIVPKEIGERKFLFLRELGTDSRHLGGIAHLQVDGLQRCLIGSLDSS